MEKTQVYRQLWIQNERPLVSEIIEQFPHLQSSKWVSNYYFQKMIFITTAQMRRDFKAITCFEDKIHLLLDNWQEWKEKLIQFAKLESCTRPFLKKLLEGLDKCDELAYPHGKKNYEHELLYLVFLLYVQMVLTLFA